MHPPPRLRFCAATALAAATLLTVACGRTIEEDEPRALVERRIEPCRWVCSAMLDPECGRRLEDQAYGSVDACAEDCAAVEDNEWRWAHQEDGTDACADEWIAAKECLAASSCEERREFFTDIPALGLDYPCKAEMQARDACFWSTPSHDKVETGP